MSKLRSSLNGKQSLDETPLINPASGTDADEDAAKNSPISGTDADEDKAKKSPINEEKEVEEAQEKVEEAQEKGIKIHPAAIEEEIKDEDKQEDIEEEIKDENKQDENISLGNIDLDIELKIRETFKSHEKLSEKEFMTLFREVARRDSDKGPDLRKITTSPLDLKARSMDTKEFNRSDRADPYAEEDKKGWEFQMDKMRLWSNMSPEEKSEINSRLYALPDTNDVAGKYHHHLTEEEWKKKLVKILGSADSDELDLPLADLTEKYANKKYYDDHFSYDMVVVLDVGDKEKEIQFSKKELNSETEETLVEIIKDTEEEFFKDQNASVFGSLKRSGLKTHLYYSCGEDEIYCLVGASEKRLRREAERTRMSLLLEPEKVLQYGLDVGYKLAKRIKNPEKESSINVFKNIYGHYKQSIDRKLSGLYKHYVNNSTRRHPNSIFTPIDRLKLTRTIIEAELVLGGAGLTLTSDIENPKKSVLAFFPLHNHVSLQNLESKMLKVCSLKNEQQPVIGLREYFGEQVGMYFHFLYKYVVWLIIPSILGTIGSIWQLGESNWGVAAGPLFGFMMCIWSTAFLEQWKRDQAVLRMKWGMTRFRETETDRPEFEGNFKASAVTGEYEETVPYYQRLGKILCSQAIVFAYVIVVVVAVFGLFIFRAIIKHLSGNFFLTTVLPPVLNAVIIMFFNVVWGYFALILNDWENHKTDTMYEDSRVMKSFAFKFVNSYFSLFYIVMLKRNDFYTGYCKESYVQLVNLIDSSSYWFDVAIPTPNTDVELSKEWYVVPPTWFQWNNFTCAPGAVSPVDSNQTVPNAPVGNVICNAWDQMKTQSEGWDYRGSCLGELGFQLVIIFSTQMIVNNLLEIGKPILANHMEHKNQSSGEKEQSIAELEFEFVAYEGTFDDYDELVVQFGYVTLFVGAFPLVPFLALINNWLENRIDGSKLLKLTRRPHPKATYDIGTWEMILNVISYFAILTTVSLALLNTNQLFAYGSIKNTTSTRLSVFLVLEHVLVITKVLVAHLVDDTPIICIENMGRQEQIINLLIGG